ncbi:hypothetical protein V6Z12_A01G061600 [Gossypium hirsutum]
MPQISTFSSLCEPLEASILPSLLDFTATISPPSDSSNSSASSSSPSLSSSSLPPISSKSFLLDKTLSSTFTLTFTFFLLVLNLDLQLPKVSASVIVSSSSSCFTLPKLLPPLTNLSFFLIFCLFLGGGGDTSRITGAFLARELLRSSKSALPDPSTSSLLFPSPWFLLYCSSHIASNLLCFCRSLLPDFRLKSLRFDEETEVGDNCMTKTSAKYI